MLTSVWSAAVAAAVATTVMGVRGVTVVVTLPDKETTVSQGLSGGAVDGLYDGESLLPWAVGVVPVAVAGVEYRSALVGDFGNGCIPQSIDQCEIIVFVVLLLFVCVCVCGLCGANEDAH